MYFSKSTALCSLQGQKKNEIFEIGTSQNTGFYSLDGIEGER